MKKILAILLAFTMLATGTLLISCDEEENPNKGNENQNENNDPSGSENVGGNQTGEEGTGSTDTKVPTTPSEGLKYELTNNKSGYAVKGIGTCRDTEIVIPSEYQGKPVVVIMDTAFNRCTGLTSITIPDSVTSIGRSAFSFCNGLTSITIGNGVASIGDYTFNSCTELKNVTIGNSVTSIGASAFYNCTGLTSVKIGNSVTSIGEDAFSGCTGLKDVYISDIASWCKIDFASSYSNPLRYTHNLYLNGTLVTELIIPDGVTSIGNYAFYECTGLTSVTIPNSVTSIGDYAFQNCYKLVEVIKPSSLNIIAGNKDNGKVGYNALEVHNGESKIDNQNGYLFYTHNGTNYLLGYTGNDTALNLPSNYNGANYEIYKYAFYNNYKITSVTITDNVTSIGDSAFNRCSGLTSITIPNSVTSIGGESFKECNGLTNVTIPGSITSIGYGAFSYCNGLKNVTLEEGIETISNSMFSGCYTLKNVIIPDSVTSIETSAFSSTGLVSITIPNSVTNIEGSAFLGCYTLIEVINRSSLDFENHPGTSEFGCIVQYALTIHDGDTQIKNKDGYLFYTYNETNYLLGYTETNTALTLPTSYNGEKYEIYEYAFYNDYNITSITIPEKIVGIGWYAFDGCKNLTSAEFEVNTGWKAGAIDITPTMLQKAAANHLSYNYSKYPWKQTNFIK